MKSNQDELVRIAVRKAAETRYDVVAFSSNRGMREPLLRAVRRAGDLVKMRMDEVEGIENFQKFFGNAPFWRRWFHWREMHAPVDTWQRRLQQAWETIDDARQKLGMDAKQWAAQ